MRVKGYKIPQKIKLIMLQKAINNKTGVTKRPAEEKADRNVLHPET